VEDSVGTDCGFANLLESDDHLNKLTEILADMSDPQRPPMFGDEVDRARRQTPELDLRVRQTKVKDIGIEEEVREQEKIRDEFAVIIGRGRDNGPHPQECDNSNNQTSSSPAQCALP
jgi:hypothetical protein